ncbi:hypothetical protein SFUMM280S_06107 [Streptomyces fumanus]
MVEEPVAFAHIDCDWYDSVRLCIERIADRVSVGGIILFDDYVVYSGCRKAVHQWLGRDERYRVIHADRTLAAQAGIRVTVTSAIRSVPWPRSRFGSVSL